MGTIIIATEDAANNVAFILEDSYIKIFQGENERTLVLQTMGGFNFPWNLTPSQVPYHIVELILDAMYMASSKNTFNGMNNLNKQMTLRISTNHVDDLNIVGSIFVDSSRNY